jgi:hypothetical protein
MPDEVELLDEVLRAHARILFREPADTARPIPRA